MVLIRWIGGCLPLFLAAVLFDVLGLVLLFVGIFANLRIDGRFYGDFLIYSGSLIIFLSLAFWLMWYVGNVQVSEDNGFQTRSSITLLARKLSERLSQKLKRQDGVKCVEDCSQVDSPARKASRVTWGRSTAYHNEGFDGSLDSPAEERRVKNQEGEDKEEL